MFWTLGHALGSYLELPGKYIKKYMKNVVNGMLRYIVPSNQHFQDTNMHNVKSVIPIQIYIDISMIVHQLSCIRSMFRSLPIYRICYNKSSLIATK
jgi:hypothetical protein